MKRRFLLLSLQLLMVQLLWAGAYSFHHPGMMRQLYGHAVYSMLEDYQGYLWFGTGNGLYRYDGYDLLLLDETSPAHLASDQAVNMLQEDGAHYIWISQFGLSEHLLLDEHRQRVEARQYLRSLGMEADKEYYLHVDTEGNLWQVMTDTVAFYDFSTRSCRRYATPGFHTVNNLRISVKGSQGTLYVLDGTLLWTFHQQYDAWEQEELSLNAPSFSVSSQSVMLSSAYVDLHGGLWVYSLFSEELLYHPRSSREWIPIHLPQGPGASIQNSIRYVVEDASKGVWIATDHRGLFLYHPATSTFEHFNYTPTDPDGLSSENVNQLLVDSSNNLWLGYFRTGVSYCMPNQHFIKAHAGPYGNVTALLTDARGGRWIGTDGKGLWYESADGKVTQQAQIPNISVTDLQFDHTGRLWIGTYDHGIYRIDNAGHLQHFDAQSGKLPHDGVQRMAVDSKNRLWVSSAFSESFCFNAQTETYRIIPAEDNSPLMGQAISFDSKGDRILLATFYGLWVYDLKSETGRRMVGARNGALPFHSFQYGNILCDDFSPLVWMSSSKGLSVWDTQADTLYLISKADGLRGTVQAIRQDREHNIWASTVTGLSMIRASRQADGSWGFNVRTFLSPDDQQKAFFNPYAGDVSQQGEVFFGGPEGYVSFDVQNLISEEDEQFQPRISAITLRDSIIAPEQLLQLRHDDHPITFTFYTGSPLNAEDARYAYRIRGLQDEWIETRSNSMTLLSLPSGDYQLELKASCSGEWSDACTLPMSVSPPWWNSWWMWCIYVFLLVCVGQLLVFATRYLQRRKALDERKQLILEQQSRLAEMKLQFFTDISHDLRTPLTLIISPLEQLLKENLPEAVNHRLQNMHKNAQQLMGEVNTLLDFRKLDVGAEQLRPCEPRDVIAFIHEHGDQYYDVAHERKVSFRESLPQQPVIMAFDEDKLRKILYNLLSNAFKHSPDEGEVLLSVQPYESEPNTLLIKVTDQGTGIPDAEKQRIFELFYQATEDNPKPGSGIGLHIARQFVELHHGRLWVEDNQPQGAVFCFTLPIINNVAQGAVADVPVPSVEQEPDSLDAPRTERGATAKPTVLVVDDNEDLCHFIEESLITDYRVICAANGEEALEALDREAVHLVVSDVMMPGISGLELCNRIKSNLRYSHIPVILLTARVAEQSVMEGLQVGADDYLTKPFNVDRLRLRISKFIEWSSRSHRTFQQSEVIEPHDLTITPLDEKFLQKAIDLVNENLKEADFGVESLAAGVGMSRSQLYKKLMAVTGKSPLDFIRSMRMKRACQLLDKSQMQISEVAYQVGFNTLKTFTENFKQEFGMTPSEYLRKGGK